MDVHVYQHGAGASAEKQEEKQQDFRDAMLRRRNRMSEIQSLKDNRIVGENREALLSIRNMPAGDWGNHVTKTVAAENEDRLLLMNKEAEEKQKSLEEIQNAQWEHWQRKSFGGEWIEVRQGDTYRWIQKQGG